MTKDTWYKLLVNTAHFSGNFFRGNRFSVVCFTTSPFPFVLPGTQPSSHLKMPKRKAEELKVVEVKMLMMIGQEEREA